MFRLLISVLFVSGTLFSAAHSSDACSTVSLEAKADVAVSDGRSYQTVARYHTKDQNSFSILRDKSEHYGIEGPFGWHTTEEKTQLTGAAQKAFALGHQFHAMLVFFDEIMQDVEETDKIPFGGELHEGVVGTFPYGGHAFLVYDDESDLPAGMRFEFPGTTPIEAKFSDWCCLVGKSQYPFTIDIRHEGVTYTYKYTGMDIGTPRSPMWFMESVPAPDIDEINVYRLHRKLMAAHCLGDAEMLAELTSAESISANRGEVSVVTSKEMQERFSTYFKNVQHNVYADLRTPVIEVAESGDIGWAVVNIGVEGHNLTIDDNFSDQWAWIMLARKVDGQWKHAGNASNLKPR